MSLQGKKIIIGITGGIAAYKMNYLVRKINLRRTENVSQPIEKSISAERFSVLRRLFFASYPVVN